MAGRQKRPRATSIGAKSVSDVIGRLASAEEQFLQQDFLAAALPGGTAGIRIAGALCKVSLIPADFAGFGVFRPLDFTRAQLVRSATLAERGRFLSLFPAVRLIACQRDGGRWQCSSGSIGDGRFEIAGLAPVELAEEVQTFDMLTCRYDGLHFWFDEHDARHDFGSAAYLRNCLAQMLPPAELSRPGLTAEEHAAYEYVYWTQLHPGEAAEGMLTPAARRASAIAPQGAPHDPDPARARLRATLSHAGAQLIDFVERGDVYSVTFTVGGQRHTSTVDKQNLTVQVAGICLSGEDEKFDLGSLVGVLREAEGGVLRVGDQGMPEEQYWQVHPRRGEREA